VENGSFNCEQKKALTRGVQNQTNPIEKPQTKLIQTETAKNCS